MDRLSTLSLLRSLYRELRPTLSMGQKHVYGTEQWKYILSVTRRSKENPAKAQQLFISGHKYLSYLQNTRKYLQLQEAYKGKGERSAGDMAKLMGFSMPNEPIVPRKSKSEG